MILAIDDDEIALRVLNRQLAQAGCVHVYGLSDPHLVASIFETVKPDLVILDLHLPSVDGYQILETLRSAMEHEAAVPIVVVTGDRSEESRQRALDLGAADVLTKGCDGSEFLLRIRNNLRMGLLFRQVLRQKAWLEELVHRRTVELRDARREVLERLATAAEFRDDHTGAHTRRVGRLCARIAEQLGQSRTYCDTIGAAALLHDVGKIGVPDAILLKPAKLDAEEFDRIKEHTTIGAEILDGCSEPWMAMAKEIALSHHERWDGTGYPNRIAGESIPLCGRIVAVADAFDAMTSQRPYKLAISDKEAIEEVIRESGAHFDPTVVEAFLRAYEEEQHEEIKLAA